MHWETHRLLRDKAHSAEMADLAIWRIRLDRLQMPSGDLSPIWIELLGEKLPRADGRREMRRLRGLCAIF